VRRAGRRAIVPQAQGPQSQGGEGPVGRRVVLEDQHRVRAHAVVAVAPGKGAVGSRELPPKPGTAEERGVWGIEITYPDSPGEAGGVFLEARRAACACALGRASSTSADSPNEEGPVGRRATDHGNRQGFHSGLAFRGYVRPRPKNGRIQIAVPSMSITFWYAWRCFRFTGRPSLAVMWSISSR
jgi:hypothetical protein